MLKTKEGLIEYQYWGSGGKEPHENLKTKKQLLELRFRPLKAVGYIETRKYTIELFDITNPASAVPKEEKVLSEAQKAALEKGRNLQKYRSWYKDDGQMLEVAINARNWAIAWAIDLFSTPDDWVILDTETTGLYDAEIVDIAIIDSVGKDLVDTRVRPTISIPLEATAIHGITDSMVRNSPSFDQVCPAIKEIISSKKVIIYNAEFDTKILKYNCSLYKLPKLKFESDCLMEIYAQFYGEMRRDGEFQWQKLGGNHSALGDCFAALELMQKMAGSTKSDFSKYRKKFGID